MSAIHRLLKVKRRQKEELMGIRNRILTRNRVLFLLSIILDLQEKHLLFRKDQGNSMKIINSKKSECYYRSSLETKEII